jgi:hypothetical protein
VSSPQAPAANASAADMTMARPLAVRRMGAP